MKIKTIIENAYLEDMPNGDITTNALIPTNAKTSANLIAKENGIIAGVKVFKQCFAHVDAKTKVKFNVKNGTKVKKGQTIATIKGRVGSILKSERVALNFLQRMSGIATLSNEYATKVKNFDVKILDTRKTTPNMRVLERAAVKIGGCSNHRSSLSTMAMIKDNHIKYVGSITEAIEGMKAATKTKVAVEVESLKQFKEALAAMPTIIMLDNMSIANMKKCVGLNDTKVLLEATGNVKLDTVVAIAKTGVDRISTGQLTHSYKSLDISLRF